MSMALAKLLRNLTSLDQPEDQSWAEIGADVAAGFVPGLGQVQAARDFERARREDDYLGMGLSAVSALPVVGGVGKAMSKIFGGPKAKHAPRVALKRAEHMRAEGAPEDRIWTATGTQATEDRLSPMFEIPDDKAVLQGGKFIHPELFRQYPELNRIETVVTKLPKNIRGEYDPNTSMVRINSDLGPGTQTNTAIHEFQHVVDDLEERSYGSNPRLMEPFAEAVRETRVMLDSAKAMQDAKTLSATQNIPLRRALDTIIEVTGRVVDPKWHSQYSKMGLSELRDEIKVLSGIADDYKSRNFAEDAFTNYIRNPGEVRARNSQARQGLDSIERRHQTPNWTQEFHPAMRFPLKVSDILREY